VNKVNCLFYNGLLVAFWDHGGYNVFVHLVYIFWMMMLQCFEQGQVKLFFWSFLEDVNTVSYVLKQLSMQYKMQVLHF